jgi:hypothetical protein
MTKRELRLASVTAPPIPEHRASPFVRWTGDLYVPRQVEASLLYGDAAIEVSIRMVEVGTRAEPVVKTFRITASVFGPSEVAPEDDKRAVTPADVRVPWESMIEAALSPLAHRLVVGDDGVPTFERLVPWEGLLSEPAPVPPLPRRRRSRIDQALLERVANAYLAALEHGDNPAQAVAENVTHDGRVPQGGTVGRWIRAAKDAGLIPEEEA